MDQNLNILYLTRTVQWWLGGFVFLLLLSGLTAFPIEAELKALRQFSPDLFPSFLNQWVTIVDQAVAETNNSYPFLAYGTDWLAFAHIVIAIAFIGPLRDPIRNQWVIEFGMIACMLVIPFALISGPIRHIPFFWQLIDCSFGVFGFVPLWICRRKIKQLEFLTSNAY